MIGWLRCLLRGHDWFRTPDWARCERCGKIESEVL